MAVPLHLHDLWIGLTYLYLLLGCIVVALITGYWWIRWNRNDLSRSSRRVLVLISGLGILLSGIFWVPILLSPLLGGSNLFLEYPEMMTVYSIGSSSSGIVGGYVLWRLRRDRIRGQPRETFTE